jgi:uncharacterized protein (TIGR01777 family)
MRIGITGATGFIASYLIPRLREHGHSCVAFSRNPARTVAGCDETRRIDGDSTPGLHALDVVVNLAGESILGRWTKTKKARIRASRIGLTNALVRALPQSEVRALISASATGFYGDRGDAVLPESAGPGSGFLPDVCRDWESAALAAEEHRVRVAIPRIGFVLAPRGGAIERMRPLFRLGLGGRLGSGKQWMPWVHVDDICGLIIHLLENDNVSGAFNAVAPSPVTNAEFTRELAARLGRPAFLHIPVFVLRLAMGELSHIALDSTRAVPEKAVSSGYSFKHEILSRALI